MNRGHGCCVIFIFFYGCQIVKDCGETANEVFLIVVFLSMTDLSVFFSVARFIIGRIFFLIGSRVFKYGDAYD